MRHEQLVKGAHGVVGAFRPSRRDTAPAQDESVALGLGCAWRRRPATRAGLTPGGLSAQYVRYMDHLDAVMTALPKPLGHEPNVIGPAE